MPMFCTRKMMSWDKATNQVVLIDCPTRANFGYESGRAIACAKHAKGMVDVMHDKCQHKDCSKHASFAYHLDRPKFCRAHAESDMVNVVTKRCKASNCNSYASCGFASDVVPPPGFKCDQVYFCSEHKTSGMINILSGRKASLAKKRLIEVSDCGHSKRVKSA